MTEDKEGLRQLVVFSLSSEAYGVPITQVQEIIRLPDITRMPGTPDFIEGIINLRGRIIPVIDMRRRFSLEKHERNDKNRIVVTDIGGQIIGLIVDGVSEVLSVSGGQVGPIPPSMVSIGSEYLSGVVKTGKSLVILLDLVKVLNDLEKTVLDGMVKSKK